MSLWRQLTRGLRVLNRRQAADQDLDDEVQSFLDEAAAENVQRGLAPAEARRAARVAMGGATQVREQVRAYGWENLVGTFIADLRYGWRQLRSQPGFALVSVVTLALGIGASTAIFSAVNPILFAPLPYPQPRRVMMLWDLADDGSRVPIAFGTYRELAQRSRSFEALAVLRSWQPSLTGVGQAERLEGQRVGADYFRAIGVPPLLGRDFQASDDTPSGPNVVILSNRFWRERLGANPGVVGSAIRLNDSSYTVIGVMPAGFENVLTPEAQLWAPLQYDTVLRPESREWGHHLRLIGRLREGVSLDQARSELSSIAKNKLPEFTRVSWADMSNGLRLAPMQGEITAGVRPALLAVMGAVLLLLVIAGVNVTNLLLARGAQRQGEFAVRAALGAARGRLLRQVLTESVLLALLGGGLGMLVAEAGVKALLVLTPAGLPRANEIGVNGAAFAFALAVSTLIGICVGLAPALHAWRRDLHTGMQAGSRRTAGGHQWTRRVLVVAEVGLALVLLVSAGLLLRSLQRLFAVDPGFNPERLLTMQVQRSGVRVSKEASGRQFLAQALEAVRQAPGVNSAALTSQLPLSGDVDGYGMEFEHDINLRDDHSGFRYAVSPGYFETIGIPLRRGRLLNDHDIAGSPLAVVVSESLVRRKFPNVDPIGQRMRIGGGVGHPDQPWFTIVGVVGNVKQLSLADEQNDAVYTTIEQWSYFVDNPVSVVVRTSGDAAALAPTIRQAIGSVDKDQPIVRVATMENLIAATAAERRFSLVLFEAFAIAALVLAAIGIYGVLSGSVSERMREIGVRSALGATPARILRLVLGQGMSLALLGVVIGLAAALAATQALLTLLFSVSRLDPVTYVGVIAMLLGVSAIACWLPAWRAAQVDPSVTLRAE